MNRRSLARYSAIVAIAFLAAVSPARALAATDPAPDPAPAPSQSLDPAARLAALQAALERTESSLRDAVVSAQNEFDRLSTRLSEANRLQESLRIVIAEQQSEIERLRAALFERPAESCAVYESILERHRPALVTVKFVQKTQGRAGMFDGESEINAVMIEPTGLVLCSNSALGLGGRFRGRTVPTDIKVLIGDDTEGRPATFIARDSELDLAWLQIDDANGAPFAAVDLDAETAAADPPQLGDPVLGLGVMGKFFGQQVLVSEGRVAGFAHRPRKLYVVRGGPDTDYGLPVFTAAGRVLGVVTVQRPDDEELRGSVQALMARGGGLILPVDAVVRATARAKEIAAQEAQEASAAEEQVDSNQDEGSGESDYAGTGGGKPSA